MIFAHSYTYRTYPVEVALRKCVEYGYDGLELWHLERDDFAGGIRNAFNFARRYGIRIPVISFWTCV